MDGGSGAASDALAGAAVNDLVIADLLGGHLVYHRFLAVELAFVDVLGDPLHTSDLRADRVGCWRFSMA
jgi:hypothetical protein